MRIAVISDVHGNRLALEAVLADIERQRCDSTVNLGDHAAGPMEPQWTADILTRAHWTLHPNAQYLGWFRRRCSKQARGAA